MNPLLFDFGFLKIYWYSVIIFIALLIGGYVILAESKRFKIPEKFMLNIFFFLIPISIIGARLYYVIFNWSYYSQNITEIFTVWKGGLAIHGAIILGLLWIVIYTKKYKVKSLRILDFMVVGVLIGQAIGRWGNFFNGEAHGGGTTLSFLKSIFIPDFIIDGMKIGGVYYHPTFLYESLWCFLGFILLVLIRRMKYIKIGQITGLYFIWYGIGRFFIEYLRTDSLMFGSFKIAQIISIGSVIVGIILLIFSKRRANLKKLYNDKENVDEVRY